MKITKAEHQDLIGRIRVSLDSINNLQQSVNLLVRLEWTQAALNEFVDVLKDHMDLLKDMADEFKDELDKLKD